MTLCLYRSFAALIKDSVKVQRTILNLVHVIKEAACFYFGIRAASFNNALWVFFGDLIS